MKALAVWMKHAVVVFVLILLALGSVPTVEASSAGEEYHTVQRGETLTHIARAYGTTVERLMSLNNLSNADMIRIGQRLLVSTSPVVHVVRPGETLSEIASRYGVSTRELSSWNGIRNLNHIVAGQELIVSTRALTHIVQRGETVSAIAARYGVNSDSLVAVNNLASADRIHIGQKLLIPPTGGGAVEVTSVSARGRAIRRFGVRPLDGSVSSGFGPRGGRMHEGIDIAAPHGATIRAVAAGKVAYADWAGSYGLLIKLEHPGDIETRYAHLSRILVNPGEMVQAGQPIARVGSTGRSSGPHLHFEVRVGGEAVDPIHWLP